MENGQADRCRASALSWRWALLITVLCGGCSETRPPGEQPPNVLVIVLDSLRQDVSSLEERMPFLNTLRGSATSFDNAYSTADNSPSAHHAILTGLANADVAGSPVDMGLPHQLRLRGYETFGVSANGTLSAATIPVLAGFHTYSNLYEEYLGLSGEARTRALAPIDERLERYSMPLSEFNRSSLYCSADRVLERVEAILAHAREPFMGFINILEPHDPYLPDTEFYSLSEEEVPAGFQGDLRERLIASPRDATAMGLPANRAWSLSSDLDDLHIAAYRQRYEGDAFDADRALRRVFDLLAQSGFLENTVVVVTSDHGESFGEQGFLTHSLSGRGSREAVLHVPLVVVLPERFAARPGVVRSAVRIADIAPSVYELLGIDWTALIDHGDTGRPLLDFLLDRRVGAPDALSFSGETVTDPAAASRREQHLERLRALGYIQ